MTIQIKLWQVILILSVVSLSIFALFRWSEHKYQLKLDNASTALYRSDRDIKEYEIIVSNLSEYVSEQELLVVSKDEAIRSLKQETERLRALNIKHVNTIGELRMKIDILIDSIPPSDTLIIYKDCNQDIGSYVKLPLFYRYDDKYVKLTTTIGIDGLSDMNFAINPFDINVVLGTKKESLFKKSSQVSIVSTSNPYVDVEAVKFMVVEDKRKSPLYYYGVGAGSATGLIILLNLLLQ